MQQQKAEKMNSKVKTPFSYYEGFGFWNTVFEYYSILLMIVLIMASLYTAPIFSESYSSGADAIFRTTKFGRKRLGFCRVVVAEIYGIILFVIASVLFLGISAFYFGTEGLKSSIQMMTIYSIADMTYAQALLCVIISGAISVLGTVSIVAFFSSKMKNPVTATILSILLIVGCKAVSMLFNTSSIVDFILTSLPMSGTDMIYQLHSLKFFSILGMGIWEPYWSIISGIVISVLFFFVAVKVYSEKKY